MQNSVKPITRRKFIKQSAQIGSALTLGHHYSLAKDNLSQMKKSNSQYEFSLFDRAFYERPTQSLSFDRIAEELEAMGFDGLEASVRKNSHVLPERVEEDLPRLAEALRKRGKKITIIGSQINEVTPLNETVLRTAKSLGITQYRMAHYRYDHRKPVHKQIESFRPVLKDLVDMNKSIGITGAYHNHSGPSFLGALGWDLHSLIKDYDPKHLAVGFDVRHATVEAGLSWPVIFNLLRPHFSILFMKDFVWDGSKSKHVPFGKGNVSRKFANMLKGTNYTGPISLHTPSFNKLKDVPIEKVLQASKADLISLKSWLALRP